MVENVSFGHALEALKRGRKVFRKGWKGKGMFLFLLEGGDFPKPVINDEGLRNAVKDDEGDTFRALPCIRMKTEEGSILTGWLASQTDMLSEDWCYY